jgi:hypothetical protein
VADIQAWNTTDASNVDLWPEGMLGGSINDSGRAMQGVLARWFADINGSLASSGSSNAFTVTSSRTIASLTNGLRLTFVANHTITGAATLNLNTLGAKDIKRFNGSALSSGDIISGQPVDVIYSLALDDWIMVSALAALVGSTHADFGENGAPGNPAADTARLYAKDVSTVTRLAYRDSAGNERVLVDAAETPGSLVAILEDQKAQNTEGGTFTSGADRTRDLNTEVYVRDSLVTLAANQFTLPAGSWEIEWAAPAGGVDQHQSLLYNVTGAVEVARGSSAFESGFAVTISAGRARVVPAVSTAYEIRHRATSTFATNGFGLAANFGTEVYTRVTVRRA